VLIRRDPCPSLQPFVETLWISDETGPKPAATRELVLPTGAMHLVIRLSEHPLRLYDDIEASTARTIGCAVVGGARAAAYVRDVSRPVRSVGAQLRPGVGPLLLGASARELADRHTALEDLWGRLAVEARERLIEAPTPPLQLDLFEALLSARIPCDRALHPVVAGALERFARSNDIGAAVEDSGTSHRRFIALFHDAVGLTPKLYCRVQRLHRALDLGAQRTRRSWSDLALDAGFSDQAHLNRDFRELAGLTPGRYRRLSPSWSRHVPID
jgi:AraC-like DNA-binding protein